MDFPFQVLFALESLFATACLEGGSIHWESVDEISASLNKGVLFMKIYIYSLPVPDANFQGCTFPFAKNRGDLLTIMFSTCDGARQQHASSSKVDEADDLKSRN